MPPLEKPDLNKPMFDVFPKAREYIMLDRCPCCKKVVNYLSLKALRLLSTISKETFWHNICQNRKGMLWVLLYENPYPKDNLLIQRTTLILI